MYHNLVKMYEDYNLNHSYLSNQSLQTILLTAGRVQREHGMPFDLCAYDEAGIAE